MTMNAPLPWREVLIDEAAHTISGDVRIIEAFPVPQLATTRRVWIYLPRSYSEGNRSYPVWYLHDGQNVFDQATSWGSEWGVDEALERMALEDPALEAIVVAVDHGDDQRNHEYNFAINSEYGFGGKGEAHAAFVAETLKPYIDSRYRTLPEAAHTMIGGSSFGAYISLFAAIRYPDRFGRVGGISFVMWHDEGAIMQLLRASALSPALRVYLSIGELETDNPAFNKLAQEHVMQARQAIVAAGVPEGSVRFDYVPGGTHHESTWSRLFPQMHRWLLQP
ncbi:alpha/beta hydrolase [Cohnella sp. GCM10020058]|uniref:alpha/beta hydrolase n=1 Tax=Cohnella sp. GCM10020058 TaxID=3317330 RepID=UPI00363A0C5C